MNSLDEYVDGLLRIGLSELAETDQLGAVLQPENSESECRHEFRVPVGNEGGWHCEDCDEECDP